MPGDFTGQIRAVSPRTAKFQSANMPADFTDAPYLKSVWMTL